MRGDGRGRGDGWGLGVGGVRGEGEVRWSERGFNYNYRGRKMLL